MNYSLEFEIHELPKTMQSSKTMHWAQKMKYVTHWHGNVWAAAANKKPPTPLAKAKLTLTRCSSVEPDFDNLVISFKPVIDGLKACGIILDDKVSNIGQSSYAWERAPSKQGKIRVRVEFVE